MNTNKPLKTILFLLIIFLITTPLFSAPINPFPGENSQSLTFFSGIKPEFNFGILYQRPLDLNLFGRKYNYNLLLEMPEFLIPQLDTWSMKTGINTLPEDYGNPVDFSIMAGMSRTKNVLGTFSSLTCEIGLHPALFYYKGFYLGVDLKYSGTLLTYIQHSAVVTALYPIPSQAPATGLYLFTKHQGIGGITIGIKPVRGFTILLDGGVIYSPNSKGIFLFGDIGNIPFYMNLGFSLVF